MTTYTVIRGYQGRDNQFWAFVRGLARPVPAERAFDEGEAVRIENGRAVK